MLTDFPGHWRFNLKVVSTRRVYGKGDVPSHPGTYVVFAGDTTSRDCSDGEVEELLRCGTVEVVCVGLPEAHF